MQLLLQDDLFEVVKNTLVFDIGKTHIKSILFNYSGKIIAEYKKNQEFSKKFKTLYIIEVDKNFKISNALDLSPL